MQRHSFSASRRGNKIYVELSPYMAKFIGILLLEATKGPLPTEVSEEQVLQAKKAKELASKASAKLVDAVNEDQRAK